MTAWLMHGWPTIINTIIAGTRPPLLAPRLHLHPRPHTRVAALRHPPSDPRGANRTVPPAATLMDDELTSSERAFLYKQRLFVALNNFAWAVQRPASDGAYINLCGGDTALMARHYGGVQSMNNLGNMFLSPLVGTLSDAVGRRRLLGLGRIGWVGWFLLLPHFTSLRQRQLGELLCWSLLSAGNWTVCEW
jgi:hypothetical protein